MTSLGEHTYSEILSQPIAWADALVRAREAAPALQRLWQAPEPAGLLFTGCGSTYYLSLAVAALARELGLAARAVPASELWLFTPGAVSAAGRTVLVAVSRSGETSETLRAVDAYRNAGGRRVVAVTCYPDSALPGMSDLVVSIAAAQEQSVAQTRSFASMLVACQVLIAALAGQSEAAARLAALPELGKSLLEAHGNLAALLGADLSLERFFFLGNGPLYGLAQEGMLKMKEMSLSYSEAYHTLEFRHGPKSMVDPHSLVIGLLSDPGRDLETRVLAEMSSLGGRILALAGEHAGLPGFTPEHEVALGPGLSWTERLVLYLPILQLIAYHRAVAKGLDPDRPRNLTAAVIL